MTNVQATRARIGSSIRLDKGFNSSNTPEINKIPAVRHFEKTRSAKLTGGPFVPVLPDEHPGHGGSGCAGGEPGSLVEPLAEFVPLLAIDVTQISAAGWMLPDGHGCD